MHGEYEFIQPALYAASIGIWFSVDGNGQITIKNINDHPFSPKLIINL